MPLTTGARLGPYEILALLGAGGMGEVYRARDTRLNRDVALKVLPEIFARDAERMARFEREAQVLASLNHPNIAALYGLEESEGVRALVMELVEGPTLAGPLPLDEALPLARQITEALEYAHDRGIVHRDLKPANIKVTPDGTVKVLDFGLAKALDDDPGSAGAAANSPTMSLAMTRAGVLLGTAAYMSPDQAKGKPADRRADIWAFGVVLVEMLTGRPMYRGENVAETLAAVIRDEPAIPEAPPAVRALLRRCLEKDPRRRLQSIGEARIILESEPQITTKTPRHQEEPRFSLVSWCLGGGIAVLVLALAAVSFLHFRETPPTERVLRYFIPPPEKTAIATFSLSPDGRYLAIAATAGGKRRLWIRPLDTVEPQPLPGADDAQFPFWSPDSRQIAFFAQGKLRKVSVNGGPAQTLCDAPTGRGGTWNREGVILFTPGNATGLQRVPAAGGTPAAVTPVESAGGTSHRHPVFLPDGRRFLYVAIRAKEKDGIHLASLDSSEDRRLLPDASSVVYVLPPAGSPHGHLLFLRENTLVAQPVDPKTLQLLGEMFPVAEGVSFAGVTTNAPISVSDNGTLVYQAGRSTAETQLAWFDRSGKPLGPLGAPGRIFGSFSISPDGKKVALPRGTDGRTSDLWLHEVDRGTETRFTFHASINIEPVWSPDGSRIAFASNRGGPYNVYGKPASGATPEEPLLEPGLRPAPNQWSRDGRFLVLEVFDPKTIRDLAVLPLEADRKVAPFLATEFQETQGQLSPDGRWMAYTSDESGQPEVYVQAFPRGSGPEGKWRISTTGGTQPRWRRDGKELFYLDGAAKLMAVPVKAAGPKAGFDVGTPEPLFDTRAAIRPRLALSWDYDVTADGKRFLVSTSGEQAAPPALEVVTNWQLGVKK